MNDKDVRYFPHDHNARNDPKIQALIKKYGVAGYGRFWIIIETMREETGQRLKEKAYVWQALAGQMQCSADEVKQFVKDCIEEFELFIQDDGFFYSESLIRRMAKLEAMRQKKRSAAYIMHEKYGHNITQDPLDNE